MLEAACAAGAVIGNDISGFADPDYLVIAARHRASVVATHIRLAPRVRDPEPRYDDLVADVAAFLVDRAGRARAAGLAADQIVLDAGLDLGKTAAQSAVLLRESDRLAGLGYPLLLSASNKTFLGVLLDLAVDVRRAPSLTAVAYGVIHGCRILRVHDVAGTVRVVRMVERLLEPKRRTAPRAVTRREQPGVQLVPEATSARPPRARGRPPLPGRRHKSADRRAPRRRRPEPGPRGVLLVGRAPETPTARARRPATGLRSWTNALGSASTPPFGTERRVIVIREVGALGAADAEAVARYLADPSPTTALVLVGGGGRISGADQGRQGRPRTGGPHRPERTGAR